jgi:hypothetical protein
MLFFAHWGGYAFDIVLISGHSWIIGKFIFLEDYFIWIRIMVDTGCALTIS